MLLFLTRHLAEHEALLSQLRDRQIGVELFQNVLALQEWLEVNHDPQGLILDCIDDSFESFLIRFSLQYAGTPILLLKDQPLRQLELRLLVFSSRLALDKTQPPVGRILLVDDSVLVRGTYAKRLQGDGFQVDVAEDAETGFAMAKSQDYDLAIIDYLMPGANGAELCRRLGTDERTADLLKAILTAEYNPRIVSECLQAGARECLFKNEAGDLFLARIRTLCRSVQRRVQLERERSRLIGLLHAVPEGVYGVSADGRIQFVNPATVKLLGRSVVDLLGRRPHQCIHPVDSGGQRTTEDLCFLQQAYMLQDELRDWRTPFARADGSLFTVECNVTPLGLPGSGEGAVVVFRDISEQQRLEQNWQWQLNHDHLTGLLNRGAFEEILERELAYLSRLKQARQLSLLLFIDLDRFKQVNDKLGHAAGDQLLATLAEQLKFQARASDQIARLSGDEFAVLLSGVDADAVEQSAERYRAIFEATQFQWEGESHQITGSVGAVVLDQFSDGLAQMMARADGACQQAKLKGRNQWCLYRHQETPELLQGDWRQRLQNGLENDRFLLLQQGLFDAADSARRVGLEFVARLREADALLTPSLFLAKAQRYGLAAALDRHLLKLLIRNLAQRYLPDDQWIALELTVDSLREDGFVAALQAQWQATGFDPSRLVLEFSESDLFKLPSWKSALLALKAAGFRLTLNHFGLNCGALLNLPALQVDFIKLDPSLTSTLETDPARRYLIDAIVATARLGTTRVIASHVENGKLLDLLQARGVDVVQGQFLGLPVSL